jgi:hypothetical protein
MKKKALIYALLASTLLCSVTSCDDKNNNNSGVVDSDTSQYNFEDDEMARKVFAEFSKTYGDISYEDFLKKATKDSAKNDKSGLLGYEIVFRYNDISIYLSLNGDFTHKGTYENGLSTSYTFINNEWVKTGEGKIVNGKYLDYYEVSFNEDGTFNQKVEKTFDVNGNDLSKTTSKYINNEWVKIFETKQLNENLALITYEVSFNEDGTFDSKTECTYSDDYKERVEIEFKYINNQWVYDTKDEFTYSDDLSNFIYHKTSKYINNEWVKVGESKRVNGEEKLLVQGAYTGSDWTLTGKTEFTYDDNWNLSTETSYRLTNGQWEKSKEFKYINGVRKTILSISYKEDGTPDSKLENTYDEDGKELTSKYSEYINDEWVTLSEHTGLMSYQVTLNDDNTFDSKYEYTYDADGNNLTWTILKYVNNEWVVSQECRAINGNLERTYLLQFNDDNTFDSKYEWTYDANGAKATETRYVYLKGEWVKTDDSIFINGEEKHVYDLRFDEKGNYDRKFESTYDADGKELTSKYSEYINDEWVKLRETKTINGESKELYSLQLNDDGTFASKHEYTYDEDGKKLTSKYSKYINDEWVTTSEDTGLMSYQVTLNDDNTFASKVVWTYDENGNQLTWTTSKYIDNEWVVITDYKSFKVNTLGLVYTLTLNDDNTFASKSEYTYDENGNRLNRKEYKYINSDWVLRGEAIYINDKSYDILTYTFKDNNTYNEKNEYTYDENGNRLTWVASEFRDNIWYYITKKVTTYNKDNNILTDDSFMHNGLDWEYKTQVKCTYNDNGKIASQTVIEYTNGKYKSKTESLYDINGNLLNKVESNYENNAWVFETKEENTYDAEGNKLTKIESKFIDNNWVKIREFNKEHIVYILNFKEDGSFNYIIEYTYDANGKELTEIYSYYENSNWVYTFKYEYTYDANGKELTEIYSSYGNGEWQYRQKWEKSYNANGIMTSAIEYIFNNNNYSYKTEYTYDENGNTLSEIQSRYENGKWVKMNGVSGDNKIVYKTENVQQGVIKEVEETYDKNDKLLTALEIYYWNDKPSKKTEITYDDNENVAVAIAYDYVNDEWVLFEKYEFSYDEKGVSTGLIISNYVNDAWLYRTKQEYIYDANGNKIEEYDSKYVNGKWIVCEKLKKINGQEQLKLYYNLALNEDGSFNNQWESDYDENGREILTICQNYVNNEWVYTSKTEYTYDENGNILSVIHSRYENGEWVVQEEN